MAMVGWVLTFFWLVPVARGDYNCSKSRVQESQMADFKENLKHAAATLNLYLYTQQDKKMNLTSTSEKTNRMVWMWGECDFYGTSDNCKDCVNELTANLLTICNNSTWGELTMVVKGKNVCFVHYNAVDYVDDAPTTLIQTFRHSLLFFLLWHLLMFLYFMCLI